jgi:DNA-binding transcriptional LysR family regulator
MNRGPSLREINTFVAVADSHGVARAAAVLGYTQPAVTLQLQRLEESLGVDLFERHGKNLSLTRAGHRALQHARRILVEANRFASSASQSEGLDAETFAIGVLEPTASSMVPPLLAQLRRQAPSLDIKLVTLGGDNIARAAKAGTIDVGVTTPAQVPGWTYDMLFSERLFALVPRGHAVASQSSVSVSRLASETLVLTDDTCVYRRTIERAFARHSARANVSVETGSLACLPGAIVAGLGIGIVPKTLAIPREAGLRFVPIRERIEIGIGLLRPNAVAETSTLAQFLEIAETLRH